MPSAPPLDDTAAQRRRSWRWPLLFVGVYALHLPLITWLRDSGLLDPAALDAVAVGRYAVLAALGVWMLRDAFVRSARVTRAHPWRALACTVGAVLVGEIAPLVPLTLLTLVGWMPETAGNDDAVGRFGDRVPLVVFVLVLAVLGPIVEELVFREALIERAPIRADVARARGEQPALRLAARAHPR